MNVTGTVLERNENNKIYAKFKKKFPDVEDEDYKWKCYVLKKYFRDNILINLLRLVIGIVLLTNSKLFASFIKVQSLSTLTTIICLVLGIILAGSGIMFSISNLNCHKHYQDYLWDEEGEIVEKIIKFYDKAH